MMTTKTNPQASTATDFTIIPDIEGMIASITPDSIVSRTVYQGPTLRIIVFGFAAGQELSEHTSSKEAVLHFLRGEATVTLGKLAEGGETTPAAAGTVIRMRPGLAHSVYADTDTLMLLSMMG
jgi:quercetin dioxygenase-like cupin family protein